MPVIPACRIGGDRYNYMAEVVPSAAWAPGRFLLGEPIAHRLCAVNGKVSSTYRGFLIRRGQEGADEFFEIVDAVTLAEWERARRYGRSTASLWLPD